MEVYPVKTSSTLPLGKQGENLARQIQFDLSRWISSFGPGTVQLLHQRSSDEAPYPVAVEQEGNLVVWTVTSADTASAGTGRAELQYYVGDALAKSETWMTKVLSALGPASDTPPEAQQGWVDQVLAQVARITGMTAQAVELPAGSAPTADYADGVLTIGIPLGEDMSETQIAQAVAEYLSKNPIAETDPTVPDWAKEEKKPSYSAAEVGADPSGTAESQVSAHNTETTAHSDIRLLIQDLTDRLNALADSDDTTLDQLSEIVSFIKSNRDLIAAVTTDKVSVSDIIDNLTTNVANKPLSAAQGVALKALIDSLSDEKVALPKDEDGNIIPGTHGWYAVSDGAGGITWVESAPSLGGGDTETTTHGIIWDLVNVTSSNNAVSVSDGTSLVVVLTPADGYTLGDVTITMGGEVVTGVWNADTSTIVIASVTGDVLISCAGVEQGTSGSADTSPVIHAYDTGWDGNGSATQTLTGVIGNTTGLCILAPHDFTLDVDALKASSCYDSTNEYLTFAGSAVRICLYTPFTNYRAKAYGFNSMSNYTKSVFFADDSVLHTGSNGSYNTDSPSVLTFQDNRYLTTTLTSTKLSFSCTLSTDDLDNSYAYFTSTVSGIMPVGVREGDIIFAGKNTPYYGMANIDGTMLGDIAATELSLDDDIAQDYGVAALSLTPDLAADTSTVYGLSNAYASVLETIRNEWMIAYNGNANKIPIIVHTDQHGRMTNGGNVKGLFNTIGKAFSLHDISKVMNLGDTVYAEWEDADVDHPLLSCAALENYLSTVEAIPFSKRLEVFGNHDTWYYNGYNDEGNAVGTRYPSKQNHLYKYFRNIYKKSNGNNTGYFAVCDDYFNVKYVVVSAYEYQNGTISDRMTSEQIGWIIREFSKDDGYDIVVVSHCPLYWDDTTGAFPEGAPTTTETLRIADDWIDALWAGRKNKTRGTVNDSDGGSHTFDFTGCTSDLLCALHGHTHRAGYNYVSDSLLSVAFDWFANESMYFCLIDRENRELKVWKFIGSDGDAPEYLTWAAPFDR